MSDFFEMRECLEQILKQKEQQELVREPAPKKRGLRSRVLQAAAVVVLGSAVGIQQGVAKLQEPVGAVSKAHCQQGKACTTFEFIVKG